MSAFQVAFARLARTQSDFEAVKSALSAEASRLRGLAGNDRERADRAAASSESTYLMRLLAEFEGTLTELAPHLTPALAFGGEDGLSSKLDGVGKRMGMPRALRERANSDLRLLRNDMMHGRIGGLVVDFDAAHRLMKEFLQACH